MDSKFKKKLPSNYILQHKMCAFKMMQSSFHTSRGGYKFVFLWLNTNGVIAKFHIKPH